MARLNVVNLFGMVAGDPLVVLADDTKTPLKAQAFLTVVSSNRENGITESEIYYARPFIYSEDPDIVAQMSTWKKNDLVSLKGAITTLNARKGAICAHCKEKSAKDGEITFITPIFTEVCFSGLDDKRAIELLNEHREISNQIYLIGYLCADVNGKKESTIYRDIISQSSYKGIASYQLAVNRKYYLKQDLPTNRTDYPHIVSVGKRAEMDLKCIHIGSMVMVDGMLVTREFRRTNVCPHCGKEFDWPEKVLEVLTFGTEYLSDFMTPEEYDAQQIEKAKELRASIIK